MTLTKDQENYWLQALAKGDQSGFKELFEHHYAWLCTIAYRILQHQDDAEDVVQQLFIGIWQKREQLAITTSLAAYLKRAVINASLNKLEQTSKAQPQPLDIVSDTETAPEQADQQVAQEDLEQLVHKALQSLPPRCRLVFTLSRYEHMTYQEIADHLDIAKKTVEHQMGKALQLLRKQLSSVLH